jgi:hypothetical protein
VFAAVAFPVWYAGLMRRQEVAESNQMVKDTLGEESDRSRAALRGGEGGEQKLQI